MGLSLAECAARLIGVRPVVLDADMFEPNADPLLPYRLRPGYRAYFAGGAVTVEANGHRRIVIAPQARASQPAALQGGQILLLGDSLLFGLGLDDNETIASRLKSQLAFNGLGVDVAAIGVPGYTSWNEYASFRDYQHKDNVRVVVVIYLSNDLTYDNDTLKLRNGQMAIIKYSFIHSIARWFYANVYISNVVLGEFKKMVMKTDDDVSSHFLSIDPNLVSYSTQALAEIKKLCDQKGIPLLVAIYREPLPAEHRYLGEKYERTMSGAFSEAGISSFVLKDHTDRLPLERIKVAWNDTHPSREATELLARQIYAELEARGFLQKVKP